MMRMVLRCVLGSFLLLTSAALASAQAVSTAQINGMVRDASGGALPGVTITATQTATGLKRETTTNNDGSYVVTNLPIGPYQIDVMLQGFKAFRQTGIVLEVSATIRLRRQITGEWLMAASGALSIAFGALVVVAPLAGALAVVLLIGAYALVSGVVLLALGMRLRRAVRSSTPDRRYRKAA